MNENSLTNETRTVVTKISKVSNGILKSQTQACGLIIKIITLSSQAR